MPLNRWLQMSHWVQSLHPSSTPCRFSLLPLIPRLCYSTVSERELKKKAERATLREDVNKGYFGDMSQLSRPDISTYSGTIIPSNIAVKFPQIRCQTLDDIDLQFPTHEPCLVSVVFRASGDSHVKSWVRPLQVAGVRFTGVSTTDAGNLDKSTDIEVKYYEMSVLDGGVVSLVRPFMKWSLRSQHPSSRHPYYLLLTSTEFRDAISRNVSSGTDDVTTTNATANSSRNAPTNVSLLGMTNRLLGYLFVLDGAGRVRWRAQGTNSTTDNVGVSVLMETLQKLLKK